MTRQNYLRLTLVMVESGGVGRPAPQREGAADIVVDTDHRGIPHVPATSFAGALRARVRQRRPQVEDQWFGRVDGNQASASQIWVLGSRLVDGSGAILTHAPTVRKTMTTAINRHSGAAALNTLRTAESLSAGTRFEVYLRWDGNPPMSELVAEISGWQPLIGRSTSTGHGRCAVEKVSTGTLDLADPAQCRIWLTKSGPDLVRAVARRDHTLNTTAPHYDGYAVQLATAGGPLAFSLDADGNLPDPRRLPGASIKGVVRSRMEFILRSVGLLGAAECGGVGCGRCLVCRVFGHSAKGAAARGSVGQRALLRTPDVTVAGTVRSRTHAPLDRWTGGVAMNSGDEPRVYVSGNRRGLLHTFEGIEDGLLTLRFEGELPADLVAGFEALLVLVLRDLDDGLLGMGRATTRGYGGVTVKSATGPGGKTLPTVAQAQAWLAAEVEAHATKEDSA